MAQISSMNYTFVDGNKALAAEINQNFEQLRSGHNTNDTRISDIETINNVNVKNNEALGNGTTDDTTAFNTTIADDSKFFNIPEGNYIINGVQTNSENIFGQGSGSQLSATTAGHIPLKLGRNPNGDWFFRKVSDLYIRGNNTGACVEFSNAGTNNELSGRVVFDTVKFKESHISKPTGNIGNRFNDCAFDGNSDFAYKAVGSTSPVMHAGCDVFNACHFQDKTKAAIYIDGASVDGTGQTVFNQPIIESNSGFGVFVKNYSDNDGHGLAYTPFVLRDAWFESNHSSGSVVIDGVTYTPKDMYFEGVKIASVENSRLNNIELSNSVVVAKNCNTLGISITTDNDSALILEDCYAGNYFKQKSTSCLVRSLAYADMPYSGLAAGGNCFPMPARTNITNNFKNNVVYSESFAFDESYASATSVTDGVTFPRCAEITVADAGTAFLGTNYFGAYAQTIPVDKYIVWSLDAKMLTDTGSTLNLERDDEGFCTNLPVGKNTWTTFVGLVPPASSSHLGYDVYIKIANATGNGSCTYRLGAYQILAFDTLLEAHHYIENRFYYLDMPVKHFGSAEPTTGTYKKGHKIESLVASSGGTEGWICTTAGTYGTLAGATGTIKSSSQYLTVNSISSLEKYQYINIVGVSGTKRIMSLPTAVGSTTVSSTSSSGYKTVNMTSTTNFAVNDWVKIDEGNANEEIGFVITVDANTITLKSNLSHTHNAGVTVKTCASIDSASNATVTGAAVSWQTPVFKTYGAIA